MSESNANRTAQFPAIERTYGQVMQVWFDIFQQLSSRTYADQMATFRGSYGFSQAHASALVLYCRGHKTSRRFENLDSYLDQHPSEKQTIVRLIFSVIMDACPDLEQVIAWNQPMVKLGKHYIFGLSVAQNHILIAPFHPQVLVEMRPRLGGLHLNKRTIRLPLNWSVDAALLVAMVERGIELTKESKTSEQVKS